MRGRDSRLATLGRTCAAARLMARLLKTFPCRDAQVQRRRQNSHGHGTGAETRAGPMGTGDTTI